MSSATLLFDIVALFDKEAPIQFDIEMEVPPNEEMFIKTILRTLTEDGLHRLVKLSCCQLECESEQDVLPFLLTSQGRYYFNPDVNDDEDTHTCYQWKKDVEKENQINIQSRP